MKIKNLSDIRKKLNNLKPIIHCITNPISINQCANVVLSMGARPTMAEHPKEVKEITASASALLINLGNITDARKKSFNISAKIAKKRKIPLVIDLVGISGSKFRKKTAAKLIKNKPAIIKGNYSEIYSICNKKYHFDGVDSDETLEVNEIIKSAVSLAKRTKSIILASGRSDIVTDGHRVCIINNGCSQMAGITGTGCMLGAMCATFMAIQDAFASAVYACAFMGVCGELAKNKKGRGAFMVKLLDNISNISNEEFLPKIKIEVKSIEEF